MFLEVALSVAAWAFLTLASVGYLALLLQAFRVSWRWALAAIVIPPMALVFCRVRWPAGRRWAYAALVGIAGFGASFVCLMAVAGGSA